MDKMFSSSPEKRLENHMSSEGQFKYPVGVFLSISWGGVI